jgi:hypothetical protein
MGRPGIFGASRYLFGFADILIATFADICDRFDFKPAPLQT